jgi:hypothetical protein
MPSSRSRRFLSFSVSKVSRAKKKSFAREAAYIARLRMLNHRTGRIHDHRKKGGLLGQGMVGWKGSLEDLIRAASSAEKRCDAVEGRLTIAALPSELDDKTCLGLLGNLAQHLVKKYKVGVLFALHEPDPGGDPRNKHGHLIYSSREVGEDGQSLGKKTRQWDSKKDGPQCIKDLRTWWSATLNAALEKAGYEPNVELRSYAQLGIERPKKEAKHDGIVRTAIRRRERIRMVNEFHESHSLSGNFMRLSEPEIKPPIAAQTTEAPVPADTAPIASAAPMQDLPEPEVVSVPIAVPGLRPLPEPKFQRSVLAQKAEAHAPADTAPTPAAAPVKDISGSEIAPQPTAGRGLRRLPEPSDTVHGMAASDLATAGPVATDAPIPEVPEATPEPPPLVLRRLPEPKGGGLSPTGSTGPSPGQ